MKDTLTCYLFVAPALFFFTLFIGGPILVNLFGLSFTKYNILNPPHFIGFQNFSEFFRDPMSGKIFYNTLKYATVLLIAHLVIGLLLALGVFREKNKKLRYFYRTAIYLPSIVTTASVAIAWSYMYNKDYGVINYFLQKMGIVSEGIPWLTSTK
ncbi:MAG: carbohydrate ABC transporter permease [Brevinematia bacterium]